jgi:hypothetical protein
MKKKFLSDIPFSVLELATVTEGSNPAQTFAKSLDLAQHVEKFGYKRFGSQNIIT